MSEPSEKLTDKDALERMNRALKAALETPPRKHADEPKRGKKKDKKNG